MVHEAQWGLWLHNQRGLCENQKLFVNIEKKHAIIKTKNCCVGGVAI